MRLHGSLTVCSVFAALAITASALSKPIFTTIALTSTALATTQSITSELILHRYHGRQASPDTPSSKTTTPTAEYASSESSKKDCDCAERHGSVDHESIMSFRSITTTAHSLTTSSVIASTYLYPPIVFRVPTCISAVQSLAPHIQPTPQSQYFGMPATTFIQQPGQPPAGAPVNPFIVSPDQAPGGKSANPLAGAPANPADAAIPSTITSMAPAPTSGGLNNQDIEALISRGGQPWHQVTYYECVTWPSKYVHCGWHTPLRVGRNPDPKGETFVYGAAVRVNGRIAWVVGMVSGAVMLTL